MKSNIFLKINFLFFLSVLMVGCAREPPPSIMTNGDIVEPELQQAIERLCNAVIYKNPKEYLACFYMGGNGLASRMQDPDSKTSRRLTSLSVNNLGFGLVELRAVQRINGTRVHKSMNMGFIYRKINGEWLIDRSISKVKGMGIVVDKERMVKAGLIPWSPPS